MSARDAPELPIGFRSEQIRSLFRTGAGCMKAQIGFFRKLLRPEYKPILVDYRPTPSPRYGYGRPPHDALHRLFDASREGYRALLKDFGGFAKALSNIPLERSSDAHSPFWNNDFLGGTNAVALYCLPAMRQSRTYVEVGSGNSTKFIRRSTKDNGLSTRIVSIDPAPRAEIDDLCDEVIRRRVEDLDLEIFGRLGAGDILFFDGSHRCFQNSDVTVFFLEILPALKSGVIVYIDDVYLPYDYPPEWADRWYSEQYLLATLLLADAGRTFPLLLPHVFIAEDADLSSEEAQLWREIGHRHRSGNGLWLTIRK